MPLSDTQVFVALFVALITGILSVRLGVHSFTSKLTSLLRVLHISLCIRLIVYNEEGYAQCTFDK